jgi:hypothetical protein
MQEFVDTRRTVNNAPPVAFGKDPPLELRGAPGLRNSPDLVGYLSLAIFPTHVDTTEKRIKASTLVQGLRNYLHYHIKASKTYLHIRMRKRVDLLLQGLSSPPALQLRSQHLTYSCIVVSCSAEPRASREGPVQDAEEDHHRPNFRARVDGRRTVGTDEDETSKLIEVHHFFAVRSLALHVHPAPSNTARNNGLAALVEVRSALDWTFFGVRQLAILASHFQVNHAAPLAPLPRAASLRATSRPLCSLQLTCWYCGRGCSCSHREED